MGRALVKLNYRYTGNKKSPAQLTAASKKVLEEFKKEDMKPEPVVDVWGNTSVLKVAPDHMKIIISRAIGEQLKSHIYDSEDYEYGELLSWDMVFEKLLDQIQKLKKQQSIIIMKSKEEVEEEGAETETEVSESVFESFPLYSPDGIPLRLLSSTLDKWNKLYKKVSKIEKEYVISVDAFMLELLEMYAKEKGLEKVLDLVSNYRPKSRNTRGSKHKNPKVGPLFKELT